MSTTLATRITSGKHSRPTGQFWYGPEGSRKTGTAVSPKTLFLDLEHGSDQYAVDRIHIETYHDLLATLDALLQDKGKYEILVIDPIEIAEKLLISETCRQLKIDGLQGLPHGAAWQYLRENFDAQLIARFNELRRTGRHVVIIGHAQIRTVILPGLAEPFERYEPRIDRRNADTLIEWADHVLFFDWNIRTAKNREGIVRALTNNDPLVQVVHGTGWTAKNRAGLTNPLSTEFSALAPLFTNNAPATAPAPVNARKSRTAAPAAAPQTATGTTSTTATAPDSRTSIAPPDEDDGPMEPFLTDEERSTVETFLGSLPQEKLLKFIRDRGLINDDQDYRMLGPQYCRRILDDPVGFKEAVEE
jgi:hypothetical protein